MRKTVLSALIVALLLGVFGPSAALAQPSQAAKPVVVMSFAGYDRAIADVKLVGELVDRPELAGGLEGLMALVTRGKGLAGIDKSRPCGVAMFDVSDEKPVGYGFVPITDFKALKELLQPYIEEINDVGDGVLQVIGKTPGQKVFVKPTDKWLFISDSAENLAATPENPIRLLGGLNKQYDLAVGFNPRNVPAKQRQKLVKQIRKEIEKELQRKPGEDDMEYAVRSMVMTKIQEVVLTAINDIDRVTVGCALDNKSSSVIFEVAVTARKGSKIVETLDAMPRTQTSFGGFRLPGAIMTGNMTATCPHAGAADWNKLFKMIRTKAFESIDEEEESEKKAAAGKKIVGAALDIAKEAIKSGRIDCVMSVVAKPDGVTLVCAREVPDGKAVENLLEMIVDAVRAEAPGMVEKLLKTDVGEFQGVRFHTVTVDIPADADNRDKVVSLIGEKLEIVIGIGDEAVYLAAGRNAMSTLKKAIEKSSGTEDVLPMELSISMTQAAKMMAELSDGDEKAQAEIALAALKKAAGKDHIKITVVPVLRGAKFRFEIEEGLLRIMGAAIEEQLGETLE